MHLCILLKAFEKVRTVYRSLIYNAHNPCQLKVKASSRWVPKSSEVFSRRILFPKQLSERYLFQDNSGIISIQPLTRLNKVINHLITRFTTLMLHLQCMEEHNIACIRQLSAKCCIDVISIEFAYKYLLKYLVL